MMSTNPIKYCLWAFALNIAILASSVQSGKVLRPQVTISQGTLQGTTYESHHGRNISAFLGIPYAEPPTGKLRFASPVAGLGWDGIRDASVAGNECLQANGTIMSPGKGVIGDEDCLYLNVYKPETPFESSPKALPVMVSVHGGGFTCWSSVPTKFGPQYLLDKDVILVTFNYRLGALGFLSTGDEVAPGNWGFKDQVLALKWVQKNIGYFGGDPDQVTIFGESVGGISTLLLTMSPLTEGLFEKAIAQSGSAYSTLAFHPISYYKQHAPKLSQLIGCPTNTSRQIIDCLRTVDSHKFIEVNSNFALYQGYSDVVWSATNEPDIEGAFLTKNPKDIAESGKIRNFPFMTGFNRNEGLLYTTALYQNEESIPDFLKDIDELLPILFNIVEKPEVSKIWTEAIKSYYLNDLTVDNSVILKNLTDLFTDGLFIYPAYYGAQQQSVDGSSERYVYEYEHQNIYSFTYITTGTFIDYGVSHADELISLFNSTDFYPNVTGIMSESDWKMVDKMVELWTSFAYDGKPSLSSWNGSTTWKPFSSPDEIFLIEAESNISSKTEMQSLKERIQFWEYLNEIDRALTRKSANAEP